MTTDRIANRRLYIADLARHQTDMEAGRTRMNAPAYRLIARRLREAVAGFPETALLAGFADLQPQILHVLENRHFDDYGVLRGEGAHACRIDTELLLARFMLRPAT